MSVSGAKIAGFSLIELMVVVVIMAILALLVYPNYCDYVKQGKRQKAMADLLTSACAMESYRSQNYSYEGAAEAGGNTGKLAIVNSWSPADEPEANRDYELTLSALNDNGRSYELVATPVSRIMQGDGKLMYRSTGVKAWDADNSGSYAVDSEYCWQCN